MACLFLFGSDINHNRLDDAFALVIIFIVTKDKRVTKALCRYIK